MIKLKLFLLILFLSVRTIYAQFKYDAVIVGENVKMRTSSNLKGKVIASLKTGAVVKIIQQTNVRDTLKLGNGYCNYYGYYWYEVATPTKQTGWIYGAYIYTIYDSVKQGKIPLFSTPYNINGQTFYFNIALSNTYGTGDVNEMTRCDEPAFIYFYKKNESKIFPVQLIYEYLKTTKDKNWLLLYSGEAGNDVVSDITLENSIIVMTINRSFEEGGAIAIIKLTLKNTYFEGKVHSYLGLFGN